MKPAVREAEIAVEDVVWAGMSYEEWAAQGPKLGKLARGLQWLIAAWILHGEARWSERYAQAVAETGLAPQTILNILSVARAFPDVGRRRPALSFGHHDVLAKMQPDAQDRWLDSAERGQWSVTRLRAEVKASEANGTRRPRARQTTLPAPEPVIDPPSGPARVIVGTLLDVEGGGLCKVVAIYPKDTGVLLQCVRL